MSEFHNDEGMDPQEFIAHCARLGMKVPTFEDTIEWVAAMLQGDTANYRVGGSYEEVRANTCRNGCCVNFVAATHGLQVAANFAALLGGEEAGKAFFAEHAYKNRVSTTN